LERSGKWQDTILIISSDHPWRVKVESDFDYLPVSQREKMVRDRRVPFIVRFPGQTARVDVDNRFNTIVSRLLLHDIFAGKVRDQYELKEWLAQVPAEPEED
jgi:hypothetical protein